MFIPMEWYIFKIAVDYRGRHREVCLASEVYRQQKINFNDINVFLKLQKY
jgi:hypothetical protein